MPAGDLQGRWLVADGLRRWARGCLADEAAVELLAGLGGRFCSTARPWVRPCVRSGWYWLDPAPLRGYAGRLTAHEQRTINLVVALLEDRPATVRAGRVATVRAVPAAPGRAA